MYENAKYYKNPTTEEITAIRVNIHGIASYVPIEPANIDYSNMMKLVEEGKLTIQPADNINNQNS